VNVACYPAAIAESDIHIRSRWRTSSPRSRSATLASYASLVLAHMMSETVRHTGHADILREPIEGATGR
jgi:hypothetical protein